MIKKLMFKGTRSEEERMFAVDCKDCQIPERGEKKTGKTPSESEARERKGAEPRWVTPTGTRRIFQTAAT